MSVLGYITLEEAVAAIQSEIERRDYSKDGIIVKMAIFFEKHYCLFWPIWKNL